MNDKPLYFATCLKWVRWGLTVPLDWAYNDMPEDIKAAHDLVADFLQRHSEVAALYKHPWDPLGNQPGEFGYFDVLAMAKQERIHAQQNP